MDDHVAVRRTDVIEKLGHLVNVLVFPARESMMRPHPDMISGSDLDGDMYFVSWNTKLFSWDESKHMEPMDFASLESIGDAKPPEDRQEYFTRSCCGANLGVIANAHKVFADQLGAADQKCIELAKLHSIAVDFPKVGRPANISKDLIPRSYPKWMKKVHHPFYYLALTNNPSHHRLIFYLSFRMTKKCTIKKLCCKSARISAPM